jgi:hypothetical protein
MVFQCVDDLRDFGDILGFHVRILLSSGTGTSVPLDILQNNLYSDNSEKYSNSRG